jgi:hypothetical protein
MQKVYTREKRARARSTSLFASIALNALAHEQWLDLALPISLACVVDGARIETSKHLSLLHKRSQNRTSRMSIPGLLKRLF